MPPFNIFSQPKITFLVFALIATSLVGISNRASAIDDVPEKFDIYWSGAPDAYEKFKSCIPSASEETFKSNVLNIANNLTSRTSGLEAARIIAPMLSRADNSNSSKRIAYVLAHGDAFLCINLNTRYKPIIPLSFFDGTINFPSQSSEERKALYTDLAQQLAKHGFAQALIVMNNGDAKHISYMNDSVEPIRVYYNISSLKQGEYIEQDFKPIYRVKNSVMHVDVYDNQGNSKSLIQDVLAPRPKKNGFLVISGTPQTGQFPFVGTKWTLEFLGSVLFENNGEAIFKLKNGSAVKGNWKIENNALYFQYGNFYFSSTLNTQGNELLSEVRYLEPTHVIGGVPLGMGSISIKEHRRKATLIRFTP